MAFPRRSLLTNVINLLTSRHSSTISKDGYVDKFELFHHRMSPFLDLGERLKDSSGLVASLEKRSIKEDVPELRKLWLDYNSLLTRREELASKRETVSNSLRTKGQCESQILDLKSLGKSLREEFKKISKQISLIERSLIPRVLSLPNHLLPETITGEVIFNSVNPLATNIDHLRAGEELGFLEFIDPFTYFLFDLASAYDLNLTSYILSHVEKFGFMKMSNPDFSRTLLLGGLGVCESDEIINLDDSNQKNELDKLYMTGGAHILPFCALHTRAVTPVVPVKYITLGRSYSLPSNKLKGLYSVWQNSSVNFFLATSESNYSEEVSKVVDILSQAYSALDIEHRIINCCVESLSLAEAGRISFQVYSPYHKQYIDVGELSLYKEYISRRLNMYYQDDSGIEFLQVASGSLCRVAPILATILEHEPDMVKHLLQKQLTQMRTLTSKTF